MLKWMFLPAAVGLLVGLCLMVSANAQIGQPTYEIEILSPAELEAKATNVVTGEVLGVYRRHIVEDGGTTALLIAEVLVDKDIKGGHTKPGQVVYLKYWVRSPTAMNKNPALDPGYAIPVRLEGDAKCYFNIEENGECNIVKPNGIETLVQSTESKE